MNLYYLSVLTVVYYTFHCGFACIVCARIEMSGCNFLHVIALILFSFCKALKIIREEYAG